MTLHLQAHTPEGLIERTTVIELPAGLDEHVPWIEAAFPAEHHPDPARQRDARGRLADRVPGLAAILDQAATAAHAGKAVVLRGVPALSESAVIALASAVGPVVQARADLPLVDDLVPKNDGDPSTRAGNRRDALNPHTDNSTAATPPEVLVLAVVYNSDPTGGGESTLVHVDDIAESLTRDDHEVDIALLQEPIFPSLNVPTDTGRTPTVTSVLYRRTDGALAVRYRDAALDAGITSDLAPVVPSTTHQEALSRFTARVRSSDLQRRVRLETGDMLIIDNSRFLHGRTAIGADVPRHLKRLFTKLTWN